MNISTFFILMGQTLFMMGGYQMNFNLLMAGRFWFGIGCENFMSTVIIVEWFKDYELSLAMGLSEILPLCASFSAGLIIPGVYNLGDAPNECFAGSFSVGFLLCIFSYFSMLALHYLDYKMRKEDNFNEIENSILEIQIKRKFSFMDFKKFKMNYWLANLSIMLTSQATVNSL